MTGIVQRDGYRIEKVIFDSRPDFPVTANLYIPQRDIPMPCVVGTCGHSSNGKAAPAYQSFAQGLARLGYVCLIYDPIGQGERLQYVEEDLSPRLRPGVSEHLYAGNQQFLVGEFLGMWRAWDGIRALDYLLRRKEVDQQHIGVTGNSGGGTMTTWLCGVESRWTMAAFHPPARRAQPFRPPGLLSSTRGKGAASDRACEGVTLEIRRKQALESPIVSFAPAHAPFTG